MDKIDTFYVTAQERLQSQERLAHDYGIRAFQLVAIAGVVLVAGLRIFDFPDEGDASALAALVILGVALLWSLYEARGRWNVVCRAWSDRLQSQEALAEDCLTNSPETIVTLRRAWVGVASIGLGSTKVLLWLIVAGGLGVVLVLFANSTDIGDLPILEVSASLGLFAGFSFTALFAVTSVFYKALSRGPTSEDLSEKVDLLESESYRRWIGISYAKALEVNEGVLSERDVFLQFAVLCLVVEVAALVLIGSHSVFGR